MRRMVLCRPGGGLSDMLAQVERCCRYAELHDRTVVVDAEQRETEFFRDSLARYFESCERRLILSTAGLVEEIEAGDVQPEALQGRLWRCRAHWDGRLMRDLETWVPLTFDFAKDHPQRVLVHQQPGGANIGASCLLRMRITRALGEELLRRWRAIGPDYEAIHVRHTDYKTDYRAAIAALKDSGVERLFVATDNRQVVEDFVAALGPGRVFTFSTLDHPPGTVLHKLQLDPARTFERNRDSILDLLMLGLARRLHLLEIQNGAEGRRHSGYTILAAALFEVKAILRHAIGMPELRFGLV